MVSWLRKVTFGRNSIKSFIDNVVTEKIKFSKALNDSESEALKYVLLSKVYGELDPNNPKKKTYLTRQAIIEEARAITNKKFYYLDDLPDDNTWYEFSMEEGAKIGKPKP